MIMRFQITSSASKFPIWLTKIKESISNAKFSDVFSHYRAMNKQGVPLIDHSLFPPILKACLNLSFKHGMSIHGSLIKLGFQSFTSIENSVMDFYIKSGALSSAMRVFYYMRDIDSISWNIIIHGNVNHGAFRVGLSLFSNARGVGFEPNISTLVHVIQAYRNLQEDARKIHGYLYKSGFWNISSVQNAILGVYSDVSMNDAKNLFDEMFERDIISWTVMISGYVQNEEATVALELFLKMSYISLTEVDGQTVVSVLKACTSTRNIQMGESLHAFIISKGLNNDVFVGNSLIDLYSKCHDVESAYKVFNEMNQRNVVSCNSLLCGYVYNNKHSKAITLFNLMENEGVKADEVTFVNLLQICKHFVNLSNCKLLHARIIRHGYESNELVINSLIDVYSKCNCIDISWELFSKMKRRDTVTWTTMIAGFTNCGMPNEAISICQEMILYKQEFNSITMLNLLEASSLYSDLKTSKLCHGIAIRRGFSSNVTVGTAILDSYSKSGDLKTARKVFDNIPDKNVVSWSAMIGAYGLNGYPKNALSLLNEMKANNIKVNEVTALSILSACNHGGLIQEGVLLFKEFLNNLEMGIEHYSCLVDMLARSGNFENAMDIINSLPNLGVSAWGAILSGCKKYRNFELGVNVLTHVLEMEPLSSSGYMIGWNMYATEGSWVDALKMRRLVKDKGVKVVPGYSLVYVDNKMCKFVAGDRFYLSYNLFLRLFIQELHSCMKLKEGDYDTIIIL